MSNNPIRSFLASLVASGAILLAFVLLGTFGAPQHVSAATSTPDGVLTVEITPTGRIPLGGVLTYTLTISNPLPATTPLQVVTLTHELSVTLGAPVVTFGAGITGCNTLPCTTGTVTDTALVTVTYNVTDTSLVGKPITYTTTLSESSLSATEVVTGETAPVDTIHLAVANPPTGPLLLNGRLVYTLAITNPLSASYGVSLTQTLTPTLAPPTVTANVGCTGLPCTNVTVPPSTTALVTVTYDLTDPTLLDKLITHTITLSVPALLTTDTVTVAAGPVKALGLSVTSTPAGPILLNGQLVYTLAITNPLATALQGVNLNHQVTPGLTFKSVTSNAGINPICTTWPCAKATIASTAMVTVTYDVTDPTLLDKMITHTTTLSVPALLAPVTRTGTTGPVQALGLEVTSTPAGPVLLNGRLVYTLAITNLLGTPLQRVDLNHQVTPGLALNSVTSNAGISPVCTTLPCTNATIATTALVTVTYDVTDPTLLDKGITHTTTLSVPTLLAPVTRTGTTGPVQALGLTMTSVPTGTVLLGNPLVYTLAITNPLASPLQGVRLTLAITPTLAAPNVAFGEGITGCMGLPCANATLTTTALLTLTYDVTDTNLLGKWITQTATLSMPTLLSPRTVTVAVGPVEKQKVYLPLIRTPFADPYATWQKLPQPAGGAAVNYLYVAQSEICAGPVYEQSLPNDILAATNSGIYQLKAAAVPGSLPSWELRGSATISASHIISTTALGYFASAFNQGTVLHSSDGGATWNPETLAASNQRVYWLAASSKGILAAGSQGMFIRLGSVWVADPQLTGAIFNVAASGDVAYAIQIGTTKDTLWRSLAGGAPGTWANVGQLPGAANFMQTLDLRVGSTPNLLVGTVGNGVYQLGASGLEPFSQGVSLTAYGLWRDGQSRIYAALRDTGGLQRFAQAGGAGLPLNSLPGNAPPITDRLYTVNGNSGATCSIIATGSREGNVWLRRIP